MPASDFAIDELEAALLSRFGVGPEEKENLLQPDFDLLIDPYLFNDMALAVELIDQVRAAKGEVVVYGDYDCDGLSSTALLLRFLKKAGIKASAMIPNRLDEGYGLNAQAVEEILSKAPDLVITVDCGSSSVEEIHRLMANGIMVILTDHHEVPEEAPHPIVFINPCREGENYPFRSLAGVGVCFKLVQALQMRFFPEDNPAEFLPLVAVGTVADAMPLVGENRVLVQLGLRFFMSHGSPGLLALMPDSCAEQGLTAEKIAFAMAPRLNAAGRMGDTDPALALLMTEDQSEAKRLRDKLEAINQSRRQLEAEIYQEALAQVEAQSKEARAQIICVADLSWHPGIVGIVAARLSERYQAPAICLGGQDGELRGSARSFASFDLLTALRSGEEHCLSLGGHKQAAGMRMKPEEWPAFTEKVRSHAREHADELVDELSLEALASLPHSLVDEAMVEYVERWQPFGKGNEEITFILEDVEIVSLRSLSEGKHLSISVRLDDQRELRCIAFGMGGLEKVFLVGEQVDLLGNLRNHYWQGRNELQFNLLDLRLARHSRELVRKWQDEDQAWLEGKSLAALERGQDFKVAIKAFGPLWLSLEEILKDGAVRADLVLLERELAQLSRFRMAVPALARALEIFAEAGLLQLKMKGLRAKLDLPAESPKRPQLSEQETWIRLEKEGGFVRG